MKEQEAFLKQHLEHCVLCPRRCGADRYHGRRGLCGEALPVRAGLAWLHRWEEPCLTGEHGSGAVFFSGCPLGCIFCQNHAIASEGAGIPVTIPRLAEIFLELEGRGAANINLVTACHFIPQTVIALREAKSRGLRIPVVYNSSGYETVESLRLLEGLVDIYLPDYKYIDPTLADRLCRAPDYPETARAAIREMCRQCPDLQYGEDGLLTRGVIVRHLLLPGHVRDAKEILRRLYGEFGSRVCISIMNQYTPTPAVADDPLLRRRVTPREYRRLLDCAAELGIENGFYQEGASAKESFIPSFDGAGIL